MLLHLLTLQSDILLNGCRSCSIKSCDLLETDTAFPFYGAGPNSGLLGYRGSFGSKPGAGHRHCGRSQPQLSHKTQIQWRFNMLRRWSVILVVALLLPVTAWAQNTGKIAGRVTDASSGDGMPGAAVIVEGTTLGAATDVDGNYFIIGVPVGTYTVRASFVGYQTSTLLGVDISAGYTRELDFSLEPGVELEEVVVEYERPLIQKDALGGAQSSRRRADRELARPWFSRGRQNSGWCSQQGGQ